MLQGYRTAQCTLYTLCNIGASPLQKRTTVPLTFGLNRVRYYRNIFNSIGAKQRLNYKAPPVAFCDVLMGSDIPLPWLHLALSLPQPHPAMSPQNSASEIFCIQKTKQVCTFSRPSTSTVANVLPGLSPQRDNGHISAFASSVFKLVGRIP